MLIRHSETADIKAIKALYEQPSCYANTLQLPFPSDEKWQQQLAYRANFYSLVAVLNETIVGQLGLEVESSPRRKHVANIGMAVCEQHRKQGVAAALLEHSLQLAENWLAIRRIELSVYTDNTAAIALYKQFAFVIEGTGKQYAFRDGTLVDVYFMAKVVG